MANICSEEVVIVANTAEDMAEVLEMMARNVVAGSNGEDYFTSAEIDDAIGDMEALYSLIRRTIDMNHLCLFATKPDTRSEGGFIKPLSFVKDHPVFEVGMDLKWGSSEQPDEFCADLDPERFGWSCSAAGEAYEYDCIIVNGEYYGVSEAVEKIEAAKKTESSAEDLATIAYRLVMSTFVTFSFEPSEEDEYEYEE